jgi:hypothetical protein
VLYYHFLHAEYFLSGILSPESLLEDIRVVAANKQATRIYLLSFDAAWRESSKYKLLSAYELNYLAEFLQGYAEFKRANETKVDLVN